MELPNKQEMLNSVVLTKVPGSDCSNGDAELVIRMRHLVMGCST